MSSCGREFDEAQSSYYATEYSIPRVPWDPVENKEMSLRRRTNLLFKHLEDEIASNAEKLKAKDEEIARLKRKRSADGDLEADRAKAARA